MIYRNKQQQQQQQQNLKNGCRFIIRITMGR